MKWKIVEILNHYTRWSVEIFEFWYNNSLEKAIQIYSTPVVERIVEYV